MRKKKILLFILPMMLNLNVFAIDLPKMTSEFAEILGLLDEYNGRFDFITGEPSDDSLVECFYPNEKALANKFINLGKKYEQDCQIDFKLTKVVGKQGHIYIYSDSLSKWINSLYITDQKKTRTLDCNMILNQSTDLRLSYLNGVYRRFGGNNQIAIANGFSKLMTVKKVLESLGSFDIEVMQTKDDYTPTNYLLIFKCTDDFTQTFKLTRKKIVDDLSIYITIN